MHKAHKLSSFSWTGTAQATLCPQRNHTVWQPIILDNLDNRAANSGAAQQLVMVMMMVKMI